MRAFWKKDGVVSLRLEEKVYTLAQMANDSAKMAFFHIFRETDEWIGVNLNKEKFLFCVNVGNVVVQRLGERRIPIKEVTPSVGPFPHQYMDPHDNAEGYRLRGEFMWRGARLVDVGADLAEDDYYAPTVIEHLTVTQHREIIEKNEFVNMYGDGDVRIRILELRNTGKYNDLFKKKIFPDL
jgi:hypothetical protein